MTFYKNRKKFSNISVKIGSAFSRFGLTPNQWTIISILPAIIALYYLVNLQFAEAALFFIISSFLDLVDGSVARVMGKTTKLGAYLDTMMDRYVEFLIVLGVLFVALQGMMPSFFLPAAAWVFIYLFGSMMTSYAKAAAKEKELTDSEIKGGLLERAERLIILFAGVLFAEFSIMYLTYFMVFLAVVSNITALQRACIARKASKKKWPL